MEFCIGKAELESGQPDKALARFQQASEFNPNIPESYYYSGIILADRGEKDQAHKMFRKAAALDSLDERFRKALKQTIESND